MFFRRGAWKSDRFVEWKVGIFFLGAALWVAGAILGLQWLVWVAIGVLLIGVLLRFAPEEQSGDEDQ
jgi:hypothetical protein